VGIIPAIRIGVVVVTDGSQPPTPKPGADRHHNW
jgi:hypothetical protein